MAIAQAELSIGNQVFDITRDHLWSDGLSEALADARATGKYLLIVTGADSVRSWKLGVALAFMDEDIIGLSRRFHCVMVNDKRANDPRLTQRPAILICTPEGREIVSAVGDSIEDLVPALRGMLEHVVAAEQATSRKVAHGNSHLSIRHFFGAIAHAVLGIF